MQIMQNAWMPTYVPEHLKIANTEDELKQICTLRHQCFGIYPAVKHSGQDIHDSNAFVLYSDDSDGRLTSTCRLVFDGPSGLPADQILKSEVDKLRQQGLKVAESSKLASVKEDIKTIARYFFTYYEIAVRHSIDSVIFIAWDKYIAAYKRYVDANILVRDIGYSYGTDSTFSLMECRISDAAPTIIKKCGGKL